MKRKEIRFNWNAFFEIIWCYPRLLEQDAFVGIDAAGDQRRRHRQNVVPQRFWILASSQ